MSLSASRTTPNRLATEKSPYLLQHQWNPVDWHPWGEAAFSRARQESKPIFLSIGYSTCHWCHVMERESFEDAETARLLNAHFISIKVDREERPDVDKIYMTFVQATSGQGGWPLNVFLTPDLKPFYGGTYFPPSPRQERPSFTQILGHIQELWTSRRDDLARSATELHERLASFTQPPQLEDPTLTPTWLDQATARFKADYDPRQGGFGGAPKFPRPSLPAFLLRQAVRHNDPEAQRMVVHTCDRMAAGGLHDQLGGGFHRYAVDADWLVPHFEKMLYDNAQLANLYLDVFQVTGDARHAQTARDILAYVARDMTHGQGGFFSAEDADSEGHEGKFYCWTVQELTSLLDSEELELITRRYGITAAGNFVDHSHPQPLAGQNVLSIAQPSLAPQDRPRLISALGKLRQARDRRIRPHRDDKILASWNGLMLGAFARASVILGEPRHREVAERNLRFLQTHLWDASSKTLYHRWREGEHDTVQLLDAYAFLLSGVIDLYEATLRADHLEFALELADTLIRRFADTEHGGFFQSDSTNHLILRLKEDYDGAEPGGNSVAALGLLRLAALTDRAVYRTQAEQALRCFAARLQEQPTAVPYLLQALDFALQEPHRVVLAGPSDSPLHRELLAAAHATYQPNKVVLGQTGPVEPFARSLPVQAESPVAYVCTGTACRPPTSDPAQIRRYLQAAISEGPAAP